MSEFLDSYVPYLRGRGLYAGRAMGTHWMRHNRGIIPLRTMPEYLDTARATDALDLLAANGGYLLRYYSDAGAQARNWYHVVCRRYDHDALSRRVRYSIRKGRERGAVVRLDPSELADQGHACHVAAYSRYSHARPLGPQGFRDEACGWAGCPAFETWGVRIDGDLEGYLLALVEDQGVFLHTEDVTPRALKARAGYALIDRVLDHYVNERGMAVCNGTRSVSHETNRQEFLESLGFVREYSRLNIVYRPAVRAAVGALYPLRHVVERMGRWDVAHAVSSLLHQEAIARGDTA